MTASENRAARQADSASLQEEGALVAKVGPARPAVKRPKATARREAIMDAAEEVFAERGYYGSSLRDVSARSGAALGLITHHFPTKEKLFTEIVMRKRDSLANVVKESLEKASDNSKNPRDIIEAFIRPFLRACVDKESPYRRYIKLTSSFMSVYQVPEIGPALAELLPISNLFYSHLQQVVPDMPERKLRMVVYLIDAALVFMVQDTGFIDRVTHNQLPVESINELIAPAADFFAGGLRALA